MDFKLSKKKIMITLIITLVWWIFLVAANRYICTLIGCISSICTEEFIRLIPECCACATFKKFISDVITLLVPGMIYFTVHSLADKKKK